MLLSIWVIGRFSSIMEGLFKYMVFFLARVELLWFTLFYVYYFIIMLLTLKLQVACQEQRGILYYMDLQLDYFERKT